MRDPFLETEYRKHWTKQAAENRARLAQIPDLAELRKDFDQICAAFFMEHEDDVTILEKCAQRHVAALPAQSGSRARSSMLKAIENLTTISSGESENLSPMFLLLAESMGRTLARKNATTESFDRVLGFVENVTVHQWYPFASAWLDEVKASDDLNDKWVSFLSQVPSEIPPCLEMDPDGSIARILSEREVELRTSSDPNHIWKGTNLHFYLCRRLVSKIHLLLELNATAALKSLDQLPSTDICSLALEHLQFSADPDLITSAIEESAPPIEGGQYTRHPMLLLSLSGAIEYAFKLRDTAEQAERMADGHQERERAQKLSATIEEKITRWFEQATGQLLERVDGPAVGIEFLAFLSTEHSRLSDRIPRRHVIAKALQVLASGLVEGSTSIASFKIQAARIEGRSQYLFLLAASYGELLGSPTAEHAQLLWRWYTALLATPGEAWNIRVNPYMADQKGFLILGHALAVATNPIEEWRTAWLSSFQQRFLARFDPKKELVAGSEHLILTGMGVLDGLTVEGRAEQSRAMWEELLLRFRHLVYGQSAWLCSALVRDMALLFAYLPHIFENDALQRLRKALPILVVEHELALRSVYWLIKNKVSIADVSSIFEEVGTSLDQIVEPFTTVEMKSPPYETPDTLKMMAYEILDGGG